MPIIGYNELFDFNDDASLQKALSDIAKLGEEYEKVSTSIRESLGEMKKANKDMAESILASTEKLDSSNESNRQSILDSAKAADMLSESNKRLKKTEEDILKADIQYEQQMNQLISTMSTSEKRLAGLRVVLDSVKDAATRSKKEFEAGRLSQEQYVNILAKNTTRQRELKTEISNIEKSLKSNSKEVQANFKSYEQMDIALKRLQAQYKGLTDEQRDNSDTGKEILAQITEYDEKLKELDAKMGIHNRKVGQYENATRSMRSELYSLVEQMVAARLAGEQDSEAYQQMEERASELKNSIKNVNAEVKMMASDTRAVDTMIQAFEGLTAAFGLAQGAQALLGMEDDKLAKSFQKLQAVMVILNSLQSIQNILQKESAVYNSVVLLQSKLKTASKNLETAAESKNIVVKGMATAAQWALNVAMNANPAGVILLAIVALTAAFVLFAMAADNAAENQNKLNEVQKLNIESTNRQFDSYQAKDKKVAEGLENEIALMKAQGKSKSDIYAKEMQLLNLKSRMANQSKGYYADEIANLDGNKKKLEELKTKLDEYNLAKALGGKTEVVTDFKTGETKIKSVDDEDIQAVQGMIDNITSQVQTAETAINSAAQTEIDTQETIHAEKLRLQEAGFKSRLGYIDAELIAVEKGSKKELDLKIQRIEQERRKALSEEDITAGEIAKINADANDQRRKAEVEYRKFVMNEALTALNIELVNVRKGSQEELNIKTQSITKQMEIDLLGEKLSADEKKLIRAKANKEIEDLEREHNIRVQQSRSTMLIQLKEAEIAATLEGTDARYQLEAELNNLLKQQEIDKVNNSLELNQIEKDAAISKITAETDAKNLALLKDRQLRDIDRKKNDEDSANNIKRIKLESQAQYGTIAQRRAAQAELKKLSEDQLKSEFDNLEELHKKGLISEQEYLNEKNALNEKAEQEKLKIIEESAENQKKINETLISAGADLINMGFEAFKNASDAKIATLEKDRDYELSLAGDNEKQKTAINEKYNKKIKDEKRKAAIAEKAQAIFQAGMNTALAITSALATVPFLPMGPIMAVTAGILGAAQIAVIAAKPIPQYWRGTDYAASGFAWVAENGPEAIRETDGTVSMAYDKQVRYMHGGEKVYTAGSPETRLYDSVLSSNASSSRNLSDIATDLISMKNSKDASLMIEALRSSDMSELKQAFENAVSKLPIHQNHWDEKGFHSYLRTQNSRIEQMNNRYKTGGEG